MPQSSHRLPLADRLLLMPQSSHRLPLADRRLLMPRSPSGCRWPTASSSCPGRLTATFPQHRECGLGTRPAHELHVFPGTAPSLLTSNSPRTPNLTAPRIRMFRHVSGRERANPGTVCEEVPSVCPGQEAGPLPKRMDGSPDPHVRLKNGLRGVLTCESGASWRRETGVGCPSPRSQPKSCRRFARSVPLRRPSPSERANRRHFCS